MTAKAVHMHGPLSPYTDCLRLKKEGTLLTRTLKEVTCKACMKNPNFIANVKYFGIDSPELPDRMP